jgi:hypothetical protein
LEWVIGHAENLTVVAAVSCLMSTFVVSVICGAGIEGLVAGLGTFLIALAIITISALSGSFALGSVLWLAACWYRRQVLLADRAVAQVYGRNLFLQAMPKYWAVQRSFSRQWASMVREVRRSPDQANVFSQFRNKWDNLPDDLKKRAFREVTVGFRSLLYFEPVFADRAASVAQFPSKLFDDRPAAQLLPNVTEMGADMAQTLWLPK